MDKLIKIIPSQPTDHPWISDILTEHWGASIIISKGYIHNALELPGYIGYLGNERAGLIIYNRDGVQWEIVSLISLMEGIGIGTALIEVVRVEAQLASCKRLWLITTNDNLQALKFYQKRGFHLVAVYPDALQYTRKIKPSLAEKGLHGIPLRDEIELELIVN